MMNRIIASLGGNSKEAVTSVTLLWEVGDSLVSRQEPPPSPPAALRGRLQRRRNGEGKPFPHRLGTAPEAPFWTTRDKRIHFVESLIHRCCAG
jgi:hypothetical protein